MIWGNKVIKKKDNKHYITLSQFFTSFRDKKIECSIFNHIVSAKAAKSSYLICFRMLLKKSTDWLHLFFFLTFLLFFNEIPGPNEVI